MLEWAGRLGFATVVAQPRRLAEELQRRCLRQGYATWAERLAAPLLTALRQPITDDGVALGDLTAERCRAEIDFLLPVARIGTDRLDALVCAHEAPGQARPRLSAQRLHGMLRGFIDLVFEHEDRFWIVDYKSNHLGSRPGAYGDDALRAEVLHHRYDLQYVLYTLALHRLLAARLPDYDYDRHFGGVRYLFLRALPDGTGIHRARPDRALVEGLEAAFRGADHAS